MTKVVFFIGVIALIVLVCVGCQAPESVRGDKTRINDQPWGNLGGDQGYAIPCSLMEGR